MLWGVQSANGLKAQTSAKKTWYANSSYNQEKCNQIDFW